MKMDRTSMAAFLVGMAAHDSAGKLQAVLTLNEDGVQESGEALSLSSQHIASINFKTGTVTYEDGHKDALNAETLKADTEGVKLTQIQEANADGTLTTLDAGTVLEHEGYQGNVLVSDQGGTRWADVREQRYEQQTKRTGDWEGTAEQDAHRHGGGNLADAPTKTTAIGNAVNDEFWRAQA